jgi:DNA (cytosine-5)-methyltransferase 1
MNSAYYNEIDPFAAQWLRNLIAAGHIAPGDVDERSIHDVRPGDLKPYTQCHFFAGIGVWSYALRRAAWPDDKPVWTGSAPCQPFSSAGKGAGFDDQRHLWPFFHYLIEQCKPPVVFGEQVEAAIKHGWLNLIQDDLEGSGYDFAAAGIPAAGVGAPNIRQRLWFVAHAADGLADTNDEGLEGRGAMRQCAAEFITGSDGMAHGQHPASATNGFWRDADWLFCRDGHWRPVEPGTFPLAHGAAARVGRLRAYGNAINAEVAREFIAAYMECQP